MSTLHRTSFKDHSGDFCGAQRVCRRCQVLSGLLIWRETHVPFKGPLLFQPFAVVIVEHTVITHLMDTDVINVSSSKLIFVGDPPFSGKRRRNRAVSRRAPALPDGPLTGHTCQRQLKPRRAPMSPTQKCLHARSFIYLSIFTFVRGDAPRSRQCQTPNPRPCHQPNATTPPARLHGASKKQKAGRGGGRESVPKQQQFRSA